MGNRGLVVFGILGFLLLGTMVDRGLADDLNQGTKRIAAVCTTWFPWSHADVIATRFLAGFPTDEGILPPKVKIASIWIEQVNQRPDGKLPDVGLKLAAKYGVPVYPTLEGALTLGGKELAVDGVLYIGEHGDYLTSRYNIIMYPHMSHMERIFKIIDASKRAVPVYCDKQLAYSWLDSRWIYERARDLDVPLMAGSSVPLAWGSINVTRIPRDSRITEAVAVGWAGLDSYGFHIMELLQSVMERRRGGETGIVSVQCFDGQAVYEAAARGEFSMELAETACRDIPEKKPGSMKEHVKNPLAVVVRYRDGSKGTFLALNGYYGRGWGFAARVNGRTVSSPVALPDRPVNHFSYLSLNIQDFMQTGVSPTPVERSLLASGVVDFALRSRLAGGKIIETPQMSRIAYRPPLAEPLRPTAPEPRPYKVEEWNPWDLPAGADWR